MFERFGADTPRQMVILAAVVLLVALSPLGNEATHPYSFFVYRTLLAAIAALCAIDIYQRRELLLCPGYVALCLAALFIMWLSYHVNIGSRFEGAYVWQQHLLFGAAFLGFASLNRRRPDRWKVVILSAVVAIDVIYLVIDLVIGRRPVSGPFVNANYYASFLTVGFAITVAAVLYGKNIRIQGAAALTSGFLFFGLTQAWSRGAVMAAIALTCAGLLRLIATGVRSARQGNTPVRLTDRPAFNLRTGLTLAAIVALAFSGILALSPGLTRKFLDRGEFDPYNYSRPKVWMATMDMIADHPLLGVGMGQFDQVSIRFAPPNEAAIGRYMKRIGIAHSQYLQYAAEIGIPGAILFFGLAGYLVVLAMRRARGLEGERRVFQEAAILTAVGLGTHALVDNNWTVPVMAAGLMVFAVGDVLPSKPLREEMKLNFEMTRPKLAMLVMLAIGLYLHTTFIPALGQFFNETGHRAYDAGDLERAESLHRLAAGILPDSPVLLENVGQIYMDRYAETKQQRFLNDALLFYSQAIAADPNAPRLHRHLENVFIQQLTGDPEKDLNTHRKIIEVDRRVLERDPFNPFVRRNLAEALYHSGAVEEAERELAKAIELEPNFVPGHLRLADWSKETGKITESDAYRSKAMSIVAKYQDVARPEPYEALLLGRTVSDRSGGSPK